MPRRGEPRYDRTSRVISIAGLALSTIATLVACLAWYGNNQEKSILAGVKVTQLLNEAQDLIGETSLHLRSLCARPRDQDLRLEQASRKIDEALRYQTLPTNYRAYCLLADVHTYRGDYPGALKIIDEALKSVPDEHTLHATRGNILFRLGQFRDSANALEKALKLSSENMGYQISLGYVLHKIGESERAERMLEGALQRDPSLVEAHLNLGDILRDRGLIDRSLFHFQRAVLLEPKDADAHGNVGYTYAIKGDLGEAVRELQAAIDLAPHCGQYFYNMGLVQRKLGSMEVGDRFIDRAKQLGIKVP